MNKVEIVLGAGCFWGVQERFRVISGVLETQVGYAGGSVVDPTYEQVCTKGTGHAEVVRVVYDRDVVSDSDIIRKFFAVHDPTQIDRQGPDVGSQYRSVIFYSDDAQREVAETIKAEDEKTEGVTYATEILQAPEFYPAEEYHQKYLMKKNVGACPI